MAPSILWFRRNLRLADNAALDAAIAHSDAIIPVYVADTLDRGGASRWWLHHSLTSLAKGIDRSRGRLIVREGDPARVLREIAGETGADAVFCTHRYEPQAVAQERAVRHSLAGAATLDVTDDSLLRRPAEVRTKTGGAYKVFTPFYRASTALGEPAEPTPEPSSVPWFSCELATLDIGELGLLPTGPDWSRGLAEAWQPGEDGAHARLEAMTHKIKRYAVGRDFPGEDATSRLSPHMHFGEISPRQVWHGITGHARVEGLEEAAEPFLRQLSWRDFSAYLLNDYPTMAREPLRPEFADFPWRENDEDLLAWQKGLTGYPIVDAGMRQLWHTGWMHNRVRMIVASLLVKHLLIPWQRGAAWFEDTLVDADMGNNSAGWQWVAGCGSDAAPYFRVFNPITQGQKFDPDGDYICEWVPELRELPKPYIHEPWTADAFTQQTSGVTIGKDYPYPIIEHKAGREQALAAYQALREATAAR